MSRFANMAALGYAAFSVTLSLASMGSAGWFGSPGIGIANFGEQPQTGNLLPLLAATLGGCVLAAAGVAQWWHKHVLDATLFLTFAAFWWVAALSSHPMAHPDGSGMGSSALLGWYYIAWTLLAFCIWIGSCRRDTARTLFALGLCMSLFAFALANWLGYSSLVILGGYLGLVTSILGIYLTAALLANDTHGRILLPLGGKGTRGSREDD